MPGASCELDAGLKETGTMNNLTFSADTRNSNVGPHERDLRAELGLLPARYDSRAINPAVLTVVKSIEIELAWLQHRGRP